MISLVVVYFVWMIPKSSMTRVNGNFHFVISKNYMGTFDLYLAKCGEVLLELFVHQDACLWEYVHSSSNLHHCIPVFRESGQGIVLDYFRYD